MKIFLSHKYSSKYNSLTFVDVCHHQFLFPSFCQTVLLPMKTTGQVINIASLMCIYGIVSNIPSLPQALLSIHLNKFETARINRDFKHNKFTRCNPIHIPRSSFKRELLNAFRLAVSSDFRCLDNLPSSSFHMKDKTFLVI